MGINYSSCSWYKWQAEWKFRCLPLSLVYLLWQYSSLPYCWEPRGYAWPFSSWSQLSVYPCPSCIFLLHLLELPLSLPWFPVSHCILPFLGNHRQVLFLTLQTAASLFYSCLRLLRNLSSPSFYSLFVFFPHLISVHINRVSSVLDPCRLIFPENVIWWKRKQQRNLLTSLLCSFSVSSGLHPDCLCLPPTDYIPYIHLLSELFKSTRIRMRGNGDLWCSPPRRFCKFRLLKETTELCIMFYMSIWET